MLAAVFAATHPERVSHLVLLHPMARTIAAPGYEWPVGPTRRRGIGSSSRPILARWGPGENALPSSRR